MSEINTNPGELFVLVDLFAGVGEPGIILKNDKLCITVFWCKTQNVLKHNREYIETFGKKLSESQK